MKPKEKTDQKTRNQQIADSMRASFRIEGIHISPEQAARILAKIEAELNEQKQ